MSGNFALVIEGLGALEDFRRLGRDVKVNAVRAINSTLETQRARAAKLIALQINLPAAYLAPAQGRLTVAQKATRASLEGRIRARGRPTSLARFVTGGAAVGKRGGVSLEVKPGQASFMRRAFLIRLPQGSGSVETKFNAGLAIRLRHGESLQNKVSQVKIAKGLYLLYGPSVQQVFLDNRGNGVADDITGETAEKLEDEFLRLMGL